jgi:hypothetical protein
MPVIQKLCELRVLCGEKFGLFCLSVNDRNKTCKRPKKSGFIGFKHAIKNKMPIKPSAHKVDKKDYEETDSTIC